MKSTQQKMDDIVEIRALFRPISEKMALINKTRAHFDPDIIDIDDMRGMSAEITLNVQRLIEECAYMVGGLAGAYLK
jgi:hypothetical protein